MSNQYKSVSCLQPCESRSELGTADPIVELSRLAIFSFLFFFFFFDFSIFYGRHATKEPIKIYRTTLKLF